MTEIKTIEGGWKRCLLIRGDHMKKMLSWRNKPSPSLNMLLNSLNWVVKISSQLKVVKFEEHIWRGKIWAAKTCHDNNCISYILFGHKLKISFSNFSCSYLYIFINVSSWILVIFSSNGKFKVMQRKIIFGSEWVKWPFYAMLGALKVEFGESQPRRCIFKLDIW